MNSAKVIVALSLFIVLLPFELHAQARRMAKPTGPVNITAQNLSYNKQQTIYTAEGDVDLRQGAMRLNADFVLYNETTQDTFAEGHVIFEDLGDVVHAERMSLNLVTQRGTIEKGQIFVKTGNFFMIGKEIEKTGESSYLVHKGEFTTCGWERPSWTFKAQEVELTMGQYATARWSTFNILGHEAFYLPWSTFPVKTDRQSGFLLPQFQLSSRDGTIFRNAYYWAISKDQDATFYLDWIEERGFKPGAEYRYFTDTMKGAWYVSDIDDRKYHHDRYQIKGEHEQLFGDMDFKTKVKYVSDYQYLSDLGITTQERAESSLRSVAFVEKPFTDSLLTVETAYFRDLTQKDNSNTLQYLPSASYFTQYIPLMRNRVYADVVGDLTNFTRDKDPRYTRFFAAPSMRIPYSWDGLNFLASANVMERAYYTDPASPLGNDTAHHEAINLQGDMNAQFVKESNTQLFNLGDLQSVISPHLQYNYTQNTSSFGNIPSIDPSDRIFNTNAVTYSFDHYLNAIKEDGQVREISLFEISQTYGLNGNLPTNPFVYQGSGNRLSEVHTRLTLFPTPNFWLVHDDYWDLSGKGLQEMVNSVHYVLPPALVVDVSHNYAPAGVLANSVALDQIWFSTVVRWMVFDMTYQITYDLIARTWINTLASLTYHPGCWGVTFSVVQSINPKDTSFHLSFNLQGITQKIGGY